MKGFTFDRVKDNRYQSVGIGALILEKNLNFQTNLKRY